MPATYAPVRAGFSPAPPQNFKDLGIPQSLVLDLMLRRLLLEGFSTLERLSGKLRLSVPIMSQVFTHMRSQQMVEVKGMTGKDYELTLSGAGKVRAGWRIVV